MTPQPRPEGSYQPPATVRERLREMVSLHCAAWGPEDTFADCGLTDEDYVELIILAERLYGFEWDDEETDLSLVGKIRVDDFLDELEKRCLSTSGL